MRLDKWLKLSRIIKRRQVANDVCDMGRVWINGRTAKASTEVKEGDRLEIRFGNRHEGLTVLAVPQGQVPAQMASTLYRRASEGAMPELDAAIDESDRAGQALPVLPENR